MDLRKPTDQSSDNAMPYGNDNSPAPQEETQFGYQQGKESNRPGYYEAPAQYNGGPPKHSGVGTLILVYAGIILAVLIIAALLFFLVLKPILNSCTLYTASAPAAAYNLIDMFNILV